jgi:hypothetical protein
MIATARDEIIQNHLAVDSSNFRIAEQGHSYFGHSSAMMRAEHMGHAQQMNPSALSMSTSNRTPLNAGYYHSRHVDETRSCLPATPPTLTAPYDGQHYKVTPSPSISISNHHKSKPKTKKPRQANKFRVDQSNQWDQRYQELQSYKADHGHCNVPRTYLQNAQLGTWINTQRKQYRLLQLGQNSQMIPDRINKLEQLGFEWSKCGKSDWGTRFQELKEYQIMAGHCFVPQRYGPNPQLGTWVNNQRTQYKAWKEDRFGPMSEERVNMLEGIGFSWNGNTRQKSSTACGEKRKLPVCPATAAVAPLGETPAKCTKLMQRQTSLTTMPSALTTENLEGSRNNKGNLPLRDYHTAQYKGETCFADDEATRAAAAVLIAM